MYKVKNVMALQGENWVDKSNKTKSVNIEDLENIINQFKLVIT